MSLGELRALADRADGVDGQPSTRVGEVRTRIAVHQRRRAVGAVLAAVLAVVLAISATSAVRALRHESAPQPVRQPRSLPTPTPEPTPSTLQRRLVWAAGSVVHLGQQRIDVGGEVAGVVGTDDGAVYTRVGDERTTTCSTTSRCGDLWFTDGTDAAVIGHASGSLVRGWQVEASASGSTVVWFEPRAGGRRRDAVEEPGEWVAYDTHLRQVVGRFGSVRTEIHGVHDDTVYYSQGPRIGCLDHSRRAGGCLRHVTVSRLDVATGRSTVVSADLMADDQDHRPRTFVHDRQSGTGSGLVHTSGEYLTHDGDRMLLQDDQGREVTLHTTASREPVSFRLPTDYPDPAGTEGFAVQMWLDDDTVTVLADYRPDVLGCRVSTGRCQVLLHARTGQPTYGFGGRG